MTTYILAIFIIANGAEHKVGTLGGFASLDGCKSFVQRIEQKINNVNSDIGDKKFRFECTTKEG